MCIIKQYAPEIGVMFAFNNREFHVRGWLRESPAPEDRTSIEFILYKAQREIEGKKMEHCLREEATHVIGKGGSGKCFVAIEKIRIVGRVKWDEDTLADHIEMATKAGTARIPLLCDLEEHQESIDDISSSNSGIPA